MSGNDTPARKSSHSDSSITLIRTTPSSSGGSMSGKLNTSADADRVRARGQPAPAQAHGAAARRPDPRRDDVARAAGAHPLDRAPRARAARTSLHLDGDALAGRRRADEPPHAAG